MIESLVYSIPILLLSFGLYLIVSVRPPKFDSKSAPLTRVGKSLLFGHLDFYKDRYDFWRTATDLSKNGFFSFHIGELPIISLSGDAGRKFFFGSNELSMSEAYGVLLGLAPRSSSDSAHTEGFDKYFGRRLTAMLNKETMASSLTNLISDVKIRLGELGPEGITDPFESIYGIVFQLTMRMVGANEIAEDRKLMDRFEELYAGIDDSASTLNVIYPNLPTPKLFKRYWSGFNLYRILDKIVKERKRTGSRQDDALQLMLDEGDDLQRIIAFILGSLFAGILNSGINAAYVFCYLALDPHWKKETMRELVSVADKYAADTTAPLYDKLDAIPILAWENELPTMDLLLKESIRLNLPGAAMRKNVGGKTEFVDDTAIPADSYLIYHLSDIHQDPDVYKDPETFDPSRFGPDRQEDKKKPFAYVGWGLGRHPCLGMRFAKLEQYIILAYFMAKFEYELTDKVGNRLDAFPSKRDVNLQHAAKPKNRMYLKYSQRS